MPMWLSMRAGHAERGVPVHPDPRVMEPPTAVGWLQRLADVSDPVHALEVWTQAALATGCLGMELQPQQLQRLGEWLVEHCADQPTRMAVRSCLVRLRVFRVLHPTSQAA